MSDQGLSIFDEPDDANRVDEEATKVMKAQGRDAAAAPAAKRTSGRKPVPPVAAAAPDKEPAEEPDEDPQPTAEVQA
ncbi:MAG: hypothetical protein WB797_10670, partial [Nocardioides sp.]